MTTPQDEFTGLLLDWRGGDTGALEAMSPLVYEELRAVAARQMRNEPAGHTLQATAVVNEAYLRLVRADVKPTDRVHFFALAARTMRRVLVDHAKARKRMKRGGDGARIDLDALGVPADATVDEATLDLDRALGDLGRRDPRKAEVVELIYFGGMTYDETAEALSISAATVDRELRFAKAWLAKQLRAD